MEWRRWMRNWGRRSNLSQTTIATETFLMHPSAFSAIVASFCLVSQPLNPAFSGSPFKGVQPKAHVRQAAAPITGRGVITHQNNR
jgi:hypothetical protein